MYSAQRGKIYNFFERSFGGGSSRRGRSGRSGRRGRRRCEIRAEEGNEGGSEKNFLEFKIRRHSEFHEKFLGKAGREPEKGSAETSLSLHYCPGTFLGRNVENDGREGRQTYASLFRGGYLRGYFDHYEPVREIQQPVHGRGFQPRRGNHLSPIPGREQPLRLGDVATPSDRKLQVVRRGRDKNLHEIPRVYRKLHFGGGSRVSKGASRRSQRLPAGARVFDRERYEEANPQPLE